MPACFENKVKTPRTKIRMNLMQKADVGAQAYKRANIERLYQAAKELIPVVFGLMYFTLKSN